MSLSPCAGQISGRIKLAFLCAAGPRWDRRERSSTGEARPSCRLLVGVIFFFFVRHASIKLFAPPGQAQVHEPPHQPQVSDVLAPHLVRTPDRHSAQQIRANPGVVHKPHALRGDNTIPPALPGASRSAPFPRRCRGLANYAHFSTRPGKMTCRFSAGAFRHPAGRACPARPFGVS